MMRKAPKPVIADDVVDDLYAGLGASTGTIMDEGAHRQER